MTYNDLLVKAKSLQGRTLNTARGTEFTVRVDGELIRFTPASTGEERNDGRKAAERFLEEWNRTQNTQITHYSDLTRNASYLVALILTK